MLKSLAQILPLVEKPARYTGGEFNLPDMDKPCSVRFCLCFPDLYEVGMSNLGVKILYHMLNETEGVVAERCFAPQLDMGGQLKENSLPLFSLETKKPLKAFDIVGFSVGYELLFSNILYMLDLAGIPFRAEERGEEDPLVIAGGPCMVNPEPIADFFDACLIGEGEKNLSAFVALYEKAKAEGLGKAAFLQQAAGLEGVYVPSLQQAKVKRAVVEDLDAAYFPEKILIPNIEIVHDRAVLELYRGCANGCRFCQACFYYRPIRFRKVETLLRQAEALMRATGYEELSLSSLSTGDYYDLPGLITGLKALSDKMGFKLSLPSLRLDSFQESISENTRKTSLTFAPEAGTQRLRNVINKNITDADIDKSVETAAKQGVKSVKLYFMIGLPGETDDDLRGIAEIVHRIKRIFKSIPGKNKALSISVSASVFVPKPLTPFQWVEQITREEMLRRQNLLKELLKIKGVRFSWHAADTSVLEGIFARGDRKLSKVIEYAYQNGAKFDAWHEHFRWDIWQQALEDCGLQAEDYTAARDLEAPLPWSFIDNGVSEAYLKKEYQAAFAESTTPACGADCRGCGANRLGGCF